MSNTKNNGGPAFPDPAAARKYADCESYSQGMTLRDYFAAKAMQGGIDEYWFLSDNNKAAEWCYKMADAMLKAREQ